MGTDPRPGSWQSRCIHGLVTKRRIWSGRIHATCTCGNWGQMFDDRQTAEVMWAGHARGQVSAAWNRKSFFQRSLGEWLTGAPSPPP